MTKFPPVICFRITSKCNYDCKYCYGPKDVADLDLDSLKIIFNLLARGGARAIVLTGGEPLLRADIVEIFHELRENNFKIFLDTNGDYFFKYKELINSQVDTLGLPIDYSSNDLGYRSRNNHDNVLAILDYNKDRPKKPKIKIGTVLSKENMDDLADMAELLRQYQVDIWKIYQFIPFGVNGVNNKNDLTIDAHVLEDAILLIKDAYYKYFKTVFSKRSDRNRAYFMINPDGTVFMPVDDMVGDCQQRVIGNIFEGDIFSKWNKVVSKINYQNNSSATYNFKFE